MNSLTMVNWSVIVDEGTFLRPELLGLFAPIKNITTFGGSKHSSLRVYKPVAGATQSKEYAYSPQDCQAWDSVSIP